MCIGVSYFNYYFNRDLNVNFTKPWNGELYFRYYPFRKMYIEPNLIYGGFVRDSNYLRDNKNYLIGGLSIGFETKIKNNFFLELDIKTFYSMTKNLWAGKIGTWGDGFLGVNYYFDRKKHTKK